MLERGGNAIKTCHGEFCCGKCTDGCDSLLEEIDSAIEELQSTHHPEILSHGPSSK